MTITLSTQCGEYNTSTRGTIKRMRRHGREYDIVLDHYIKASRHPAPFGLLVLSHKTGRYTWYNRKYVYTPEYVRLAAHNFFEEFDSYTSNYDLFDDYLDYLIDKVPKRSKNKYALVRSLYKKTLAVS